MPYDANVLRRASRQLEESARSRRGRAPRRRGGADPREPRRAPLAPRIQGPQARRGATRFKRYSPSGRKIRSFSRSAPSCWARWACPKTPWTTSPPAPYAGTPAGRAPACAAA